MLAFGHLYWMVEVFFYVSFWSHILDAGSVFMLAFGHLYWIVEVFLC